MYINSWKKLNYNYQTRKIAGKKYIMTTKLLKHKIYKLVFENSGSQMVWEDSIIYNRTPPPHKYGLIIENLKISHTHTHTHVICIAV